MNKKKIVSVIGTRPEVIKMAPIILNLQKEDWVDSCVIATAQHRDMLDQELRLFSIEPEFDLNIMHPNQKLPELTAHLLTRLDKTLASIQADAVLAQGDTTTVFVTALVCFYQKIPFFHVEAGLRSGNLHSPFPEEANRCLAGKLASLHFAPTEVARRNLLREGIEDHTIFVTGNTVIDALFYTLQQSIFHGLNIAEDKKLILVTAHRRENFGKPLQEICRAIRVLADQLDEVQFVYPVHPNPNICEMVNHELANHPRIILCSPLDYSTFVALMNQAYIILTDSGGIQEEAATLGKPTVVLRENTERLEGVSLGTSTLVGSNYDKIVSVILDLMRNKASYENMSHKTLAYGDGRSAKRIINIMYEFFTKLPTAQVVHLHRSSISPLPQAVAGEG